MRFGERTLWSELDLLLHEPAADVDLAARRHVDDAGRITSHGTPGEVLTDDAVRTAWGLPESP